jgi:hypothetical protein
VGTHLHVKLQQPSELLLSVGFVADEHVRAREHLVHLAHISRHPAPDDLALQIVGTSMDRHDR